MIAVNTNNNEILTAFDDTKNEFIQQLSGFEDGQINIIPFEGSWTAGQVAKHVILSNQGLAELMNGPEKETERKPDDKVLQLKDLFLDFAAKFNAPGPVVPLLINYQKEDLVRLLKEIKESVDKCIASSDLVKTCDAELPFFGYLTKLEATYFMMFHTQRHTRQLKNIRTVFFGK